MRTSRGGEEPKESLQGGGNNGERYQVVYRKNA